MPLPDHYATLHLPRAATAPEIRGAYRAMARVAHPDVGGSEAEMKAVNAAWEVLGDPVKKEEYDRALRAQESGQDPWAAFDDLIRRADDLARGTRRRSQPVTNTPMDPLRHLDAPYYKCAVCDRITKAEMFPRATTPGERRHTVCGNIVHEDRLDPFSDADGTPWKDPRPKAMTRREAIAALREFLTKAGMDTELMKELFRVLGLEST